MTGNPGPMPASAGSDTVDGLDRLEATQMPDRRLSRKQRLTSNRHFQEAYSQGCRWHGKFMVLWRREGDGANLRLGVVASKKVGNAVARSRAKRLLREVYRLNRHKFVGSCDVVLVARRDIMKMDFQALTDDLVALAREASLMGVPES